jgi:diphthine synthase
MVLYLVGLGLGDEKDIAVWGLETVRRCSKVFLEHYTSVLGVDKAKLEEFYGKPIILADRYLCESSAEEIYRTAVHEDVALLVVGDPLCATTHTDMMLRARAVGARVEVQLLL